MPNVHAGRLERRVRLVGKETMQVCSAFPLFHHSAEPVLWFRLTALVAIICKTAPPCDRQLEKMLAALATHAGQPREPKRHRDRAKNAPAFDLRTYLFQLCGVDLTRIDGIDVTTVFKVLDEVGADLSRFKSAKHFASWLGLCPQAGPADLHDGDQGRGVCRPRPSPLRGALPGKGRQITV